MPFLMTANCPECREKGVNSISTGYLVEIKTKTAKKTYSYFKMECPNNHIFYRIPQFPDYCYFMMNGLASFNDSNYFESFSSIYYAYERFKTTFCEAILLSKDPSKNYDNLNKKIKRFRSNSTSVAGAFSALYAVYFNDEAPEIPKKDIDDRNDIVHGVKAPDAETVKRVFTNIINFIQKIEWSFISDLTPDQRSKGYILPNYPILDLTLRRIEATREYLESNLQVPEEKIGPMPNNFFYKNKPILPIGNQEPINPNEFKFTFEEMTKALNFIQNIAKSAC